MRSAHGQVGGHSPAQGFAEEDDLARGNPLFFSQPVISRVAGGIAAFLGRLTGTLAISSGIPGVDVYTA